jgi:phosphohistidine phosphatase
MITFPDWIYRQSGALPFRMKNGNLEVLLITSRKGKRWVVPKGIVEPGYDAPDSAAKEALEEAGIEGQMSSRSLGSYQQDKWGGTCEIEVYPMKVTRQLSDWPESSSRKRAWLSCEEAARKVDRKDLRKIIECLPDAVAAPKFDNDLRKGSKISSARLLYLFRHAKSSWDDPALADIDRPLAPRGEMASKAMGQYFELADVHPNLVLCSPSARTRATLANVMPALGDPKSVTYDDALYHAASTTMVRLLQAVPQECGSVMIVGHNPGMENLARYLIGKGNPEDITRLRMKFPTAALAILVLPAGGWTAIGPGSCHLHSYVVPRDLE